MRPGRQIYFYARALGCTVSTLTLLWSGAALAQSQSGASASPANNATQIGEVIVS